jgi:molybdopterin molybdotransferase
VPPLTFRDARAVVLREAGRDRISPQIELIPLDTALGRVLARDAAADRDYPPFDRAMRDGFAVRAADLPGTLQVTGEIRAGQHSDLALGPGEAIEIMTGAPVPAGADAVVMIEHCERTGDDVRIGRALESGANIALRGSEARASGVVLECGARLSYSGVAWLAATGQSSVEVFARPRVAIVSTGDEVVDINNTPEPHQIRNSNGWSLSAQVKRAGGIPVRLPIARDTVEDTRWIVEQGLESDMLLLSGGVSAGKYDVVETVLAELGAEFFFDRVLIQPGQPLVFGRVGQKLFFGLPGNPVSGMVTFEVFARAALELLSGAKGAPLPVTLARLTRRFTHKPGLTRFLPACVSDAEVTPVEWHGSGDIAALCRANAFLVADADTPEYAAGETIPVLPM